MSDLRDKLRVLILTTSFPRWRGDHRSPFIFESAKSLAVRGCDVTVYAMHTPNSKTFEEIDEIKIHRIKYSFEKLEILQKTRAGIPAAFKENKLTIFLIAFYMLKLLFLLIVNGKQFDIIHANWTISSLPAVASKLVHKKPVFTTIHGSDINQVTNKIFRFFTKIVISYSDQIICVSNDLKAKIIGLSKTKTQIMVIPNGVDLQTFYPDFNTKKRIILFVGSLTKNKRVDLLINSFVKILQQYTTFYLYIVGDGPEEKSLINLANEKRTSANIKFFGSLSREEIADLMRQSYLFVLPSINEGFGVVLIEALASGLPCIGTRSGGIVDIINQDVGILFPQDDLSALEHAILTLINDKLLYKDMSQNARILAKEKFDLSVISCRIITAYKLIINKQITKKELDFNNEP